MRTRIAISLGACAALAAMCTCVAAAQAQSAGRAGAGSWHPRIMYASLPAKGAGQWQVLAESALSKTVPEWSSSIKAHGTKYRYTMVGENPKVKEKNPVTTIKTMVVPLSLTFQDSGDRFNASAPDTNCGVATSADSLVLNSPVFKAHDYVVGGKNLGSVQYEDMFERSEWAKYVYGSTPLNHNYGIVLKSSRPTTAALPISISTSQGVTAPLTVQGFCTDIGVMDITQWDSFVQSTIIPFLQQRDGLTPKMDVVLLLSNVVMSQGVGLSQPCCILGYHSGVQTAKGMQYYEVADYDTSGAFRGFPSGMNVSPLSHELGEWINDPSGANATPPWGNIGQVTGCQSNLEVGDPLSGTTVSVTMPNGVTYLPQELAFFSWFFDQKPSVGLHHWYSSNGTFRTPAPVC